MAERTCSIDGCDGTVIARGWCDAHYRRWKRHGSPVAGRITPGQRTCGVDGCSREHYARGWCRLHYDRVSAHGEPGAPEVGRSTAPLWLTDGSALIPLTRGQVAHVDGADAGWLSEWCWTAGRRGDGKWIAFRAAGGTTLAMHRAILGLAPGDGLEGDHINHDPLDNRRHNLRVVTPTANKRWQPSRGGSSSFVGVTWDRRRERWCAQIQIDGTMIHLGRFATEFEAAETRDRYVLEHATGHELNFAHA